MGSKNTIKTKMAMVAIKDVGILERLFFSVLGLELRAYTLSHFTSPFFVIFFQDRVS
jgi:hypothetical protein